MTYSLIILQGPNKNKIFELQPGTMIIGRNPDCDIQLDSEFVSKKHATLTVSDEEVVIEDLNSRNGTFVNGIMIQKTKLKAGDRLSFREIILEFRKMRTSQKTAQPPIPHSQIIPPSQKGFFHKTFLPLLETLSQKIEWKYTTLVLVILFITLSFLFLIPPLLEEARGKLQAEALKRGELIVKRLARENQKNLSIKDGNLVTDTLQLTTSFAQLEERIVSANIVDPKTKRILAPTERLNQTIENVGAVLRGTEVTQLTIEKINATLILISQPMYIYDTAQNEEVVGGVVQVMFNLDGIGFSSSEEGGILIRSFIILFLLGLGLYFLLHQYTRAAFRKIDDEIETATRKGYRHLELKTKFEEMSVVVRSINDVFRRTRELVTKLPEESREKKERIVENTDEILKNLVLSLSDGVAIVNNAYQIIQVNPAFEKLAGFTYDSHSESNILNLIQDQELLRNITHGLGEAAYSSGTVNREEIFVNQDKFQLSMSASKNARDQIDFYILWTKKLN